MKLKLSIICALICITCGAQTVTDTISKTRNDIAVLSEMFVESQCKDCRVVANILDDEPYLILACFTMQDLCTSNGYLRYKYTYTMTIRYREGRYFAKIDNINCVSVYGCTDCLPVQLDSDYSSAMRIQRVEFETLKYLVSLHVRDLLSAYEKWVVYENK